MTFEVLRRTRRPRGAWKNGGGTTEEVVSSPEGSSLSDFEWRVSVADVNHPGPFSAFEGVERVITVIEGAGLILDVDGVEHTLKPFRPFVFSGDAATTARPIEGSTRDVNVMTRRDAATPEVAVAPISASAPREIRVAQEEELVVLVATGRVSVLERHPAHDEPEAPGDRVANGAPLATSLEPLDAIRQRGRSLLELSGDAVVVVVRVHLLASTGSTVAHDESLS